MKNDWAIKKFEECLEKVVYTNKIQKKDFLEVGKYPIISQEKDFINGYWDNSDDLFKVKKPIIIFGDHTQVLKYVDFDFALGADGVKILQAKNSIDPRFFYYFLQNVNLGSLGYARHYRLLNEIEVSHPKSISEQQRIVAILDETFSAINKAKENAEKNLQNAREIFESYLQSIFANSKNNWEACNLEDYIKFIDYRGKTPKKTEFGIPLITAKNIKNGFIQKIPEEFIDPKDYDTWMTRGIPKIGDILFTTEAPLANVAQLNTSKKVAFAQRIIIMQPQSNKIIQAFLKYLLLSKPIKQKILEKGTGATVQGIKASLLKKIIIYFPKTLAEQLTIVSKLDLLSDETKRLESVYQKKLANLEELKKSILQKALTGALARKQ